MVEHYFATTRILSIFEQDDCYNERNCIILHAKLEKFWIDPIPAKIFEDSFAKASLPERKFVMDGIS